MKLVKTKKRFKGLTGNQIADLAGDGIINSFRLFRAPDNEPFNVRLISGELLIANIDCSEVVSRVAL